MAVDVDGDRQSCNMRGHGENMYSQRGGLAAKALRPDAERIDALEQFAFKRGIERVIIVTAGFTQQCFFCQKSRFVKRATDPDARGLDQPASQHPVQTALHPPARPTDGAWRCGSYSHCQSLSARQSVLEGHPVRPHNRS